MNAAPAEVSKIAIKPRRKINHVPTAPTAPVVVGDGDCSDWGATLLPPAAINTEQHEQQPKQTKTQPEEQPKPQSEPKTKTKTQPEHKVALSAGFKPTEDPRRAAALKAKQRYLMESFSDILYYRILDTIASVPNLEFSPIGIYLLPTPENRARDIHSCYWAGNGDIRTEGTPIVQLLQGVRDHKTGKVHPEWLWGGQTAIDNMNEFFGKQGWMIDSQFNVHTKEIIVNLVNENSVDKYRAFISREMRAKKPSLRA